MTLTRAFDLRTHTTYLYICDRDPCTTSIHPSTPRFTGNSHLSHYRPIARREESTYSCTSPHWAARGVRVGWVLSMYKCKLLALIRHLPAARRIYSEKCDQTAMHASTEPGPIRLARAFNGRPRFVTVGPSLSDEEAVPGGGGVAAGPA